jgi:hypothetical protein
VDLNGNHTINCESGSSLNLWCTEPNHQVVALSQAENAGATVLHVGIDVSNDIWAADDEIRIDDVAGALPDSEIRIIASGGITPNTITVSPGITDAKAFGSKMFLVTRNIRIINGTGYAITNPVDAHIGSEISAANGIISGTGCTISGIISGCTNSAYAVYGSTFSGIISGGHYGIEYGSGCTISGIVSGCTYGIAYACGTTLSGTISGCYIGLYTNCTSQVCGAVLGCTNGALSSSGLTVVNATFAENTCDLRRVVRADVHRSTLGSITENYEYNTIYNPPWSYVASYDHDLVPGAFRAWTRGGLVVSDANTAPMGYANSYRHMCESQTMPCFRQTEITIEPGQTLWVIGKVKIIDDYSVWPPRLEIIDPGADPLVDTANIALASAVIPVADGSLKDWQGVAVSYTNSGLFEKKVYARLLARRAQGDVYEVFSTRLLE